jgi:hypothetical protein
MPDARLGYRDGSGDVTTVPTKYADGTTYNGGPASAYYFDVNNFTLLPPGYPTLTAISPSLGAALIAAIGSGGIIGSITSTRNALGIEPVAPLTVFDHFIGATLSTDDWNVDVNGTGTAATQPNTTGFSVVTLNTGTADNGFAVLASDLSFSSSSTLLLLDARVRVDDIADVNLELGFSDAQTETSGLAFSALATVTAVATNAVMFGYHNEVSGEVNTGWRTARVRAGTATSTAITVDSVAVPPVAATWVNLSLVLALNGAEVDASWFINDVAVASATNVVALNTPLYVWVSAKTYEASDAKTFDIDYLRIVQSL